MKIMNSIFGFILTILLVFGIVYFTVPSVKDSVNGWFKEPAVEQPADDEENDDLANSDTNEDNSDNVTDEEDESGDNVQEENQYPEE